MADLVERVNLLERRFAISSGNRFQACSMALCTEDAPDETAKNFFTNKQWPFVALILRRIVAYHRPWARFLVVCKVPRSSVDYIGR